MQSDARLQQLKQLYCETFGTEPTAVTPLAAAGSARRYYRFAAPDGSTAIGTIGTVKAENRAFLHLDRLMADAALPVPRVLAVAPDSMCYLQEDLGDTSLYDLRAEGLEADSPLMRRVMELLPRFQHCTDAHLHIFYPVAEMDARAIGWDLDYFKYCFLKPSGLEPDEPALDRDFADLTRRLLEASPSGLMLRDFQTRNIMVKDGEPYLIDFQGARRGPVLYDAASFLWQARAGFSDAERRLLAEVYFRALGDERVTFEALRLYALLRTLQVLGAYGFRGLVEGRCRFMTSIPAALDNLASLLDLLPADSELARCCRALVAQRGRYEAPRGEGLTVDISSFGFRKSGPPRDFSGNGGGYVFDCRAVPNPGRLEQYKGLTGKDSPVIRYLESHPETDRFARLTASLVEDSVKRYLERGFTNLSVAYGCTGGQHRSVYFAERLARELSAMEGVTVRLTHIEQSKE